jgi:hypothetical protein
VSLAERIVTEIKARTGCLRHPRADCGATRRPVADYPPAAGDLQELASVTVCALRPSRPTHSQAARAMSLPGHLTDVSRLAKVRFAPPEVDIMSHEFGARTRHLKGVNRWALFIRTLTASPGALPQPSAAKSQVQRSQASPAMTRYRSPSAPPDYA